MPPQPTTFSAMASALTANASPSARTGRSQYVVRNANITAILHAAVQPRSTLVVPVETNTAPPTALLSRPLVVSTVAAGNTPVGAGNVLSLFTGVVYLTRNSQRTRCPTFRLKTPGLTPSTPPNPNPLYPPLNPASPLNPTTCYAKPPCTCRAKPLPHPSFPQTSAPTARFQPHHRS